MQRALSFLAGLALLGAAGCKSSGLGTDVRNDVSLRMASVNTPIAACYEEALKTNRKLKGRMVVSFATEPGTGKFKSVKIVENELPDPGLEQCVIGQVSTLALAQPTKTSVAITYPLAFSPIDAPK